MEEEIVCVVTHTLEIKSFPSEGQEERGLKKRERNWMTTWISSGCAFYSTLKSQLFADLKERGSKIALGFFFVILNDFLFLSAANFNMRHRDRRVLPGNLLTYKHALKYFY